MHAHLRHLEALYRRTGRTALAGIIGSSTYYVEEDAEYDNWNGGTYGHAVKLYLPPDRFLEVDLDEASALGEQIRDDLNKLAKSATNEWYCAVYLELQDEGDVEFQMATPFSGRRSVDPSSVAFWRPGHARVFISHRDQHKAAARGLSDALEPYGVSCFVAHDTIKPMTEWRAEIMKGLQTMEVMLVFLTDDFDESVWTNQEVGYALGTQIPIVSFKLGRKDPPGFVSNQQALKGSLDSPAASAADLFRLIADALGRRERLQEITIQSFFEAPSFYDAKARFDRMAEIVDKLTDAQLAAITDAFRRNDQLHGAIYLVNHNNRLLKFLERATGRRFEFAGREIQEQGATREVAF